MMPEFHLPRLRPVGVTHLLETEEGFGDLPWQVRAERVERWTTWGALGARRATEAQIDGIRERVLEVARNSGFPNEGSVRDRARFDAECAILFGETTRIPEAEALRDDVWSWIATVLLPDVVLWRFSPVDFRFRGGVRNGLQRLWMRGTALDRGEGDDRWLMIEKLTEDAMVQIFERPGLSGSPKVARAIAEGWVRANEGGTRNLEKATRRVILLLLAFNQVLSLDSLPEERLAREVDDRFAAALA
jgi:hypothetical protein